MSNADRAPAFSAVAPMERIKVCRAALKVSYQVIDRHDNLSPTETLLTVMMDALKALFKQPYWIIALILGAPLVALPCVTIDKDYHWATHPPTTLIPVVFGASLLACSILAFGFHSLDNAFERGRRDRSRPYTRQGTKRRNVDGCQRLRDSRRDWPFGGLHS